MNRKSRRRRPSQRKRKSPNRLDPAKHLSREARRTGYLTKEDISDRKLRTSINGILAETYAQMTSLADSAMLAGSHIVDEQHHRTFRDSKRFGNKQADAF